MKIIRQRYAMKVRMGAKLKILFIFVVGYFYISRQKGLLALHAFELSYNENLLILTIRKASSLILSKLFRSNSIKK